MLVLLLALIGVVADDAPMPLFQIEAQIVDQRDPKYPAPVKAPKIVVDDGQQATIKDEVKRAFVAAVKDTPTGQEPVIKVVNEGVNVTATPTSVGEEEISLDLVIQNARVKSVEERPIDRVGSVIQLPTVESVEVRTTKVVRLGKKTTVTCGTHSFSFVVHR